MPRRAQGPCRCRLCLSLAAWGLVYPHVLPSCSVLLRVHSRLLSSLLFSFSFLFAVSITSLMKEDARHESVPSDGDQRSVMERKDGKKGKMGRCDPLLSLASLPGFVRSRYLLCLPFFLPFFIFSLPHPHSFLLPLTRLVSYLLAGCCLSFLQSHCGGLPRTRPFRTVSSDRFLSPVLHALALSLSHRQTSPSPCPLLLTCSIKNGTCFESTVWFSPL